ncbi:MAG: hypothetical protein KJ058_00550 [Thermoanaerobaculia bacterium]|nr:hypothetical protein [Thermoanaerobaculia bacterium]
MTGYDRRQLARAERLLVDALKEVRWAPTFDDEREVALRCWWGSELAREAQQILDRADKRIRRRRGKL